VKRAALYLRVSTVDQHPESQVYDLRQMAGQRGYEITQEYTDRISGVKSRRPALDDLSEMPAGAVSTLFWYGHAIASPAQPGICSRSSTS